MRWLPEMNIVSDLCEKRDVQSVQIRNRKKPRGLRTSITFLNWKVETFATNYSENVTDLDPDADNSKNFLKKKQKNKQISVVSQNNVLCL